MIKLNNIKVHETFQKGDLGEFFGANETISSDPDLRHHPATPTLGWVYEVINTRVETSYFEGDVYTYHYVEIYMGGGILLEFDARWFKPYGGAATPPYAPDEAHQHPKTYDRKAAIRRINKMLEEKGLVRPYEPETT